MKAYKQVVKQALADGHYVAIWSCEGLEYETPRLNSKSKQAYTRLIDAIESQDWTNIVVWSVNSDGEKEKIATFAVMLDYGQDDDETICDWIVSDYADKVMNAILEA